MRIPNYHPTEERLNYLTHGVSAALSLIGIATLIQKGIVYSDSYLLIGMLIFGLCMFFTFLTSTLYHWVQRLQLKKRMRLLDHLAIYLLIAGTYTPFALNNLRSDWGILILVLIWVIAALGITYKIVFRHHFDKLGAIDTFMYVAMGFISLLFVKPMIRCIHAGGLALLVAGGAAYMVGVYFYESKTIKYNHAIWHLFVMTGAFLHYLSVLFFVLPPAV
ncbi:MAG TPA: hemolysin III family protein [Chitinophagales bacterium]|nr:hemolysin III family protein [Chitinophagales bacterium]HRK27854.1 hemolysin III family protein [Chitinophagales bacterium]